MILNELLTRQNVITKIELKDNDKELSKELKVKVMRIRLAYNKVKKAFDEDVKEFVEQITTDEYKELVQKTDRNEEEEKRFNELTSKINSDYIEFINQKGLEEISETIDDKFTEDEYAEILDINSGNDVEMYFTTELRHLEENLENSISVFELEEGNKKYRVVNKPLDILKPGENNAAGSRLNENTKYNANMIIE